jgi:hypothetical protein
MTKTTIEFGGSAAGRVIRARVTAGLAGVLASLPVGATRARVAFADENGPKGGDAIRCALEVQLPRRPAGAGEPSSRIDVRLSDDGSALADLVHAVEEAKVEISSIMTLRDRSGHKDVVIRVRTIDPRAAVARLDSRGYTVRDPRRG